MTATFLYVPLSAFWNYLIALIEPIGQQVYIIYLIVYCEKFQTFTEVENSIMNSHLDAVVASFVLCNHLIPCILHPQT